MSARAQSKHPTHLSLSLYLRGDLPWVARMNVRMHVRGCHRCQHDGRNDGCDETDHRDEVADPRALLSWRQHERLRALLGGQYAERGRQSRELQIEQHW